MRFDSACGHQHMYILTKADINRHNKSKLKEGRIRSIYSNDFFLQEKFYEKAHIITKGLHGRKKVWLRFQNRRSKGLLHRFKNKATWMRGIG